MAMWERAFIEHAKAEFPNECCGVVVTRANKMHYYSCANIADQPKNDFVLDPRDYAEACEMGEVVGICHSHPYTDNKPSMLDLTECEKHGLPWHIVAIDRDLDASPINTFVPSGYVAPYVGRPFHHGVLDCYALIRDWYIRERGITLPDYEREDEWWNKGQDLYMRYFEEAGFAPIVDTPQEGDVVIMQIRSKQANHGAVYVGDGKILHHVMGRLSTIDYYDGYWQDNTRLIVRYQR